MNLNHPDPKPSFWQCEPCPNCGRKSWATPWEPAATCCGKPLAYLAVYLPTNPAGSPFQGGETK